MGEVDRQTERQSDFYKDKQIVIQDKANKFFPQIKFSPTFYPIYID